MIGASSSREGPPCTTSSFAAAPSSMGPASRHSPATSRSPAAGLPAVGGKQGPARREIDANGLLVTPGWVDVHTHYDGQAMWDPLLAPSCWHGVTTVMFGNCGVGFAPVKKHHRGALMDLMEGVEEIPNPVLAAGLTWEWESFPNSWMRWSAGSARSTSRRRPRTCRCASTSWATAPSGASRRQPDDIAEMRRLTVEALQRRRLRLHHLAHRLAQDAGRRACSLARCRRSGAFGDRCGAGHHGRRRVRNEQRFRRRGVRAALDAQACQGNRPPGLVPVDRPLRGPAALAPPDDGGARRARSRIVAHRTDRGPADRRDDGHRHRAQPVHGAAELQGARNLPIEEQRRRLRDPADAAADPRREALGGRSREACPVPPARSPAASTSSSPWAIRRTTSRDRRRASRRSRSAPARRPTRSLTTPSSRTASISISRW